MSVYGIKSGELKWFRNYLSHRKQRINVKDVYTSWTSVHQLTVKQFATTVYTSNPTPNNLQFTLSSDLDCVTRCNQLELNTSKTQLLLMSCRRRHRNCC